MLAQQVEISGSAKNTNTCQSTTDPPVLAPSTSTMDVTIATHAFPQPHRGDPITLSKGTILIAVPPDLLDKGITAQVIHDGSQLPSTLDVTIAGSNTVEKTHKYPTIHATATVHVGSDGHALPLSVQLALPNTTWHPTNANTDVFFTQTTTKVTATLDLFGTPVTAAFDCATVKPAAFIAVAAQSTSAPTTTSTVTVAGQPATTTTTVAAAAAGSGTLPRTGGRILFLLVAAAALVDIGLGLVAAARPRRRASRIRV